LKPRELLVAVACVRQSVTRQRRSKRK